MGQLVPYRPTGSILFRLCSFPADGISDPLRGELSPVSPPVPEDRAADEVETATKSLNPEVEGEASRLHQGLSGDAAQTTRCLGLTHWLCSYWPWISLKAERVLTVCFDVLHGGLTGLKTGDTHSPGIFMAPRALGAVGVG